MMKFKMFSAFPENDTAKSAGKIIKNNAFFVIGSQGTFVHSIIALSTSILNINIIELHDKGIESLSQTLIL